MELTGLLTVTTNNQNEIATVYYFITFEGLSKLAPKCYLVVSEFDILKKWKSTFTGKNIVPNMKNSDR